MTYNLVPFDVDLITDAGLLLAQRHQHERLIRPELPIRFEDPAIASTAVAAAWQRPHTSGLAAVRDGQMVAYLIGDMMTAPPWERSGWIRYSGNCIAPNESVEIIQDLYAVLGAQWVAQGCFTHCAVIPTGDSTAINAWFMLSFGVEQVHALIDLQTLNLSEVQPTLNALIDIAGIEVRRADASDKEALAQISDVIWRHYVETPIWAAALPESEATTRDRWAELADDPEATVWLAFAGREVVGCQVYFPAQTTGDALLIPEQCIDLSVAGTRAAFRGQGINRALTQLGFAHALDNGFRYCLTDWRSTNLQAARFWLHHGFQPVAYRTVRRIDTRIAWANGRSNEQSNRF